MVTDQRAPLRPFAAYPSSDGAEEPDLHVVEPFGPGGDTTLTGAARPVARHGAGLPAVRPTEDQAQHARRRAGTASPSAGEAPEGANSMKRSLLFGWLAIVLLLPGSAPVAAQDTGDALAGLGLPELDITITATGFVGFPEELAAGRYLISVDTADDVGEFGGAFDLMLPVGVTAELARPRDLGRHADIRGGELIGDHLGAALVLRLGVLVAMREGQFDRGLRRGHRRLDAGRRLGCRGGLRCRRGRAPGPRTARGDQ